MVPVAGLTWTIAAWPWTNDPAYRYPSGPTVRGPDQDVSEVVAPLESDTFEIPHPSATNSSCPSVATSPAGPRNRTADGSPAATHPCSVGDPANVVIAPVCRSTAVIASAVTTYAAPSTVTTPPIPPNGASAWPEPRPANVFTSAG